MLKSKYYLANFKNKSLYQLFLKIKNKDFFFILFVFFIHLATKKNFPINLEFAFIEAANYFENFHNIYLENYRKVQANTVIFSLFIYYINKFFFLDNLNFTALIITSSSYFFLYFSITNFQNYFNIKKRFLLIILLSLNPVIWIYSYRINPDLISASIGFFAISLLFVKKLDKIKFFFSLFFLIVAILLKPFLLFLVLIASYQIYSLKKIRSNIKMLTIIFYCIFSVTFLISYFIWSKINLGVIIDDRLQFLSFYKSIDCFIFNLVYYLGLLVIFISPLVFCNYLYYIKENKLSVTLAFKIIIGVLFFYLGYKAPPFFGEIDFGNFFLINSNILKGFYFFLFYILITVLNAEYKLLNIKYKSFFLIFLISLFVFLIILSLSRPVQRYLIILIPFFYIFLHQNIKKNNIFYFLVILFLLINFALSTYSFLRAQVAEDVYSYLVKNSILEQTEPGPIDDSYAFKMFANDIKYYKITRDNYNQESIIFSREFAFIKVTYYLSKL